jgi:hypothetical protein
MPDARLSIILLILLHPLFLVAAIVTSPAAGDTIKVDLLTQQHASQQVVQEQTYALGVDLALPEDLALRTLEAFIKASVHYEAGSGSMLVVSLSSSDTLLFWDALPLKTSDSSGTSFAEKRLLLPPDYLKNAILRIYFWNPDSAAFTVNSASVQLQPHSFPNLLPTQMCSGQSGQYMLVYQTPRFELHYHPKTGHVVLADARGNPLTGPWQWHLETRNNNDTLRRINDDWRLSARFFFDNRTTAILLLNNGVERVKLSLHTDENHGLKVEFESRMRKRCTILRQALVIPFIEKPALVFDEKALAHEPDGKQALYLGQGGFIIGEHDRRITLLQSRQIAAFQLDVAARRLIANLTYAPAHPLIRYPLDEQQNDMFVDLSAPKMRLGQKIHGRFTLWPAQGNPAIPRLMPIPGGAEAAIVWTEHADWTDLRTQRAVHFGSDTIRLPMDAIGGFDKYGIPLTKSVFYHNPENITNSIASRGLFTGKLATLDQADFMEFITMLHHSGHEICLHTPEQHSSKRSWMRQALAATANRFNSISWIDHGYNNHPNANRENLSCDGLIKRSKHYSADLWRRFGINYLWNPALEELRSFDQYGFDANAIIPYPGFGPVLPVSVFGKHPNVPNFLLWNTTGTLEMPDDGLWDFQFSPTRLERLMSYHSIWVNHVYPAWTLPRKGFWYFDADSNLVAMEGLNRALKRLSEIGKTGRLLNTTLANLASYHLALQNIELIPLAGNVLKVINHNPFAISKLSFVATSEKIEIHGCEFNQRRQGKNIYFWFDIPAGKAVEVNY